MKKILLLIVGFVLIQPILAHVPIDFDVDPFTTLTPGGKFAVVDSGKICKLTFTQYPKTQNDTSYRYYVYIICTGPNRYQVWYDTQNYLTQFMANMSEGYKIYDTVVDQDGLGIYYFRFSCEKMAVKLLNDDHMCDIELQDPL